MTKRVTRFEWDRGNVEKCQKHGLSLSQIEALFTRPHAIHVDVEHSLSEQRLRAIGRTPEGRFVFLVFTLRKRDGETYIRPISARYMHRKEILSYERQREAKAAPDPEKR